MHCTIIINSGSPKIHQIQCSEALHQGLHQAQEIKSAKIIITDEEGKEYTAALSYGNAFMIKDELMEMGFVYWTYKARKLRLYP
jgi:hypothetical protein